MAIRRSAYLNLLPANGVSRRKSVAALGGATLATLAASLAAL